MMCFNTKHEIEKLQKLQIALRLCYDINIPSDISITRLHENARIEKRCDRRNLFLMCIMYDLYQKKMYEKIANHATRAADGYIFDLTIPNMRVYAKSPYYVALVGASMWNLLPVNVQNKNNKEQFKHEVRERLKQG